MPLENSLLKGKKLFKVPKDFVEKVAKTIVDELYHEERIVFVMIFGGVLRKEYTRDVDVAIYLSPPDDIINDYGYAEELAKKISKHIGMPVDIIVLNHAPDYIINNVMLSGKVVIDRNPLQRLSLKLKALEERFRFLIKRGE